jgi:ureidoglycolate hydrolase
VTVSAAHSTSPSPAAIKKRTLPLIEATPQTFSRYGQVVMPMEDGIVFGPDDAQLDLTRGTPRLYSMTLFNRGTVFRHITRHRAVTQCLGSMLGTPWMIGVAAPDDESSTPSIDSLSAFLVPGDRFIKLNRGTWHAGPYFTAASALFYNLELADTNIADHQTCNLAETFGLEFEFTPAGG